ncbi:MAG: 2OG-Fe(II) oxygenase [Bdellovibrio sp.]
MPSELCQQLAAEIFALDNAGTMQPASIGHGSSKTHLQDVRGDKTYWLEEATSSPVQNSARALLSQLQTELNRHFYLGLKRFEAHFALYPPGAGYDKHVDNHRGESARRITFILYLNTNWQPDHGGELSFFSPEQEDLRIARIEPRLGTLVLFRSEIFPHQVEKSLHPRLSLTGWFRNDVL